MLSQDEIDACTNAVYETSSMVFPDDTEESIIVCMNKLEVQWAALGFSDVEKQNTRRFYYKGHNCKEWINIFCYLIKLYHSNIYHNCTYIFILLFCYMNAYHPFSHIQDNYRHGCRRALQKLCFYRSAC